MLSFGAECGSSCITGGIKELIGTSREAIIQWTSLSRSLEKTLSENTNKLHGMTEIFISMESYLISMKVCPPKINSIWDEKGWDRYLTRRYDGGKMLTMSFLLHRQSTHLTAPLSRKTSPQPLSSTLLDQSISFIYLRSYPMFCLRRV